MRQGLSTGVFVHAAPPNHADRLRAVQAQRPPFAGFRRRDTGCCRTALRLPASCRAGAHAGRVRHPMLFRTQTVQPVSAGSCADGDDPPRWSRLIQAGNGRVRGRTGWLWRAHGSAVGRYAPREPAASVLYQIVRDHDETFRLRRPGCATARGCRVCSRKEFKAFLRCGWRPAGSRASAARVAARSGWWRSHARGAGSDPRVVAG